MLILVQEGLPLAPFTEVLIEARENSAILVQKDGATVEDDAIVE